MMITCDQWGQAVALSAITTASFGSNANCERYAWTSINTIEQHDYCYGTKSSIFKFYKQFAESEQNMLKILSQNILNLQLLHFSYLGGCIINDKCCELLAKANWPKLSSLNVKSDQIGNDGLGALMKMDRPLVSFDFRSTNIKRYDLRSLQSSKWAKLNMLALWKCNITRRGVKNILKAQLNNLSILNLHKCGINDQGLIELARGQWNSFKQFNGKEQSYKTSIISNRGRRAIRYGNWKQLSYMAFSFQRDTLESLRYLACSNWKNISDQDNLHEQPFKSYSLLQKQRLIEKKTEFFC